MSETPDSVRWKQSLAGKLCSRLEKIAKDTGKTFRMLGAGSSVEVFEFGGERAELVKHMENSTVGDVGGSIRNYVESWDYKRLPWWRDALMSEQAPYELLDIPVSRAARDAGVERWRELFIPAQVVNTFDLVTPDNWREVEAMKEWVRSSITNILGRIVRPDYSVTFFENSLRLAPLTEGAILSKTVDNETYSSLLKKIEIIAPAFELEYARKRDKRSKTSTS